MTFIRAHLPNFVDVDIDADVKLWLSSHKDPVSLEFRKSRDVAELMRIIAEWSAFEKLAHEL